MNRFYQMREDQQTLLRDTLSEQARKRHPELWGQCGARSDGFNPRVDISIRKDGKADGVVTFFLPPRREGGEVRELTSNFICQDPRAVTPLWESTRDWND